MASLCILKERSDLYPDYNTPHSPMQPPMQPPEQEWTEWAGSKHMLHIFSVTASTSGLVLHGSNKMAPGYLLSQKQNQDQ